MTEPVPSHWLKPLVDPRVEPGCVGFVQGDIIRVFSYVNGEMVERDPLPALPPIAHPKEKPTHYKVVSISLYTENQEQLKRMVDEAKRRGHFKANASEIIREALSAYENSAAFDALYPRK